MNVLQKLLTPLSRWMQLPGEATPGAPSKEFYRYMLQMDGKIRELEQRIYDLENP